MADRERTSEDRQAPAPPKRAAEIDQEAAASASAMAAVVTAARWS